MPIVHRKSPLSLAITASLFAMVATSAVASPQATGQSESQPAPATSAQPAPASGQTKDKKGKAKPEQDESTQTLSVVNVVGVRASQMRAIQLKRTAPDIQDSITAESIGQLPDVTITDALQRITGVQVNRDAGVGTSVDVRGLPQVGTMLNGEVFITPDQIDSQQPDFTMLPATLFRGVDVIKSPTASLTDGGISGSLNLHTYRPWDLPNGFTYSYSADGQRGQTTDKWGPEASGLISYNAGGRWGLLLSGDYSDTTRENSTESLDQYGVVLNAENAVSSAGYNGFLTPWNGAPIPSQIVQNPDGSVDVNGDGKSNGVFMGSQDIGVYDVTTQRRRKAANASFQADLGGGFTLTSDLFFARQDQHDRNVGIQFNSTNWQGATYVPLQSRNTGANIAGQYATPDDPPWQGMQLYTTQVYEKWPGDVESFSQIIQKNSVARNFNVQVDFDNGGPFTGSLRGIRDTAHQLRFETDLNTSESDGTQWPNFTVNGDPVTSVPPGTFIYPSQLGGDRVFNPNGVPPNTIPIIADFRNRNLGISLPPGLAATFANPNDWSFKTLEEDGANYERKVGLSALRFDGHYDFGNGIRLDFGVRNSIRNADNIGFGFETPVYAGMGASDPNGCMVRYLGADVVLQGSSCTAGNSEGAFRAGPLSSQPPSKLPAPLANSWKQYTNLLGSGITFWAFDPYAMDNPLSFDRSLYPGLLLQEDPGNTWSVWMKQTSGYLQADFDGHIGSMPYSGNVGVRVVRTNLDITQHLTGLPGPNLTLPADAGTQVTRRQYRDVLPAANFALDITDKLKLRLAYSKNMMPLDLSTWGGGLVLGYSLAQTPTGQIFRVAQGSSSGNPNLNPWRSTNYGASLEYYINPTSMVSLAWFRINVQSFILQGSVTNCNLPDADGVVRGHCVVITEPLQGTGNSIHGAEFDYRQGFTFLPGLLRNTGIEFNATWAPSDSGQTDLAGNKIPFQDNSKKSGNLILWYQDSRFQARVAYNYRSRRAVLQDVGGITGLEEYEAPQKYIDASVSYKLNKYAEVFLQGTNLSNEYQRYYLVWPDQEGHANFSERMVMAGIRGQW
ncbi:MAG: TonB-dependent receptor [Xanthomonadaceae bacterium]|nr:TonB-dependent receptor [Xanthomonadaceae bacterium]